MSFEEFQNRARLFVVGALEADEMADFEEARREFGDKAEAFLAECYSLSEAFALSLKPAKAGDAIKARLMEMVKNRQRRGVSSGGGH
jgi:hypothetical protein